MPTSPLYMVRKTLQLCVRCGIRAASGSVLCATHRMMNREYERNRKMTDKADLPWSLSAAPAEPRVAYTGANPPGPLPPLPATCPKCAAQLVWDSVMIYLEYSPAVRCLICGYMTDRQMLQNKQDFEEEKRTHAKGGPRHDRYFSG